MEMDGLIEPDSFDVIVLGTGMPESILAAAASNAGHSVLHLDHLDFYGSHWTSLSLAQFRSWADAGGNFAPPPVVANIREETGGAGSTDGGSVDSSSILPDTLTTLSLEAAAKKTEEGRKEDVNPPDSRLIGLEAVAVEYDDGVYSDVVLEEEEGVDLGSSRLYSLDLCGPRLSFCGSQIVNLLLRSGASNYVEFKGVDATYMWTGESLSAVPSSRADIFKDKSLSLSDKRYLMRFFKLVTDYANADGTEITKETLESPFVEFMRLQSLPASMQSIILYAIALVDTDQSTGSPPYVLKTEDGFRKLTLYLSSVGRFLNAPTAFIYPLYGQGEFSQGFCRSSAVKGALYVLRRSVGALLVDKETGAYRGVQTQTGQYLYSKKLILGPSIVPKPRPSVTLSSLAKDGPQTGDELQEPVSHQQGSLQIYGGVARYICVVDQSVVQGQSTLLVVFPQNLTVVRALQLSGAAAVCPEGKFVLHLSTMYSDAQEGQNMLKRAVDILLNKFGEEGSGLGDKKDVPIALKPRVLWSVSFKQALLTGAKTLARPGIGICDLPDAAVDCEGILIRTEEMFRDCFPTDEFFKGVAPPSEETEEELEGEEVEIPSEGAKEQTTGSESGSEERLLEGEEKEGA